MTSTAISAQGSVLSIGTGTGGAKTITGVTVGNPTQFASSAHGFNNGDRVTIAALTGADAGTINGGTYTVIFKETNSFAIAVDTTGLTITAGSGTATPVTYATIANIRTGNGFDGVATELDRTNLASTAKEYMLGLVDPGHFTFECDHDRGDPGQIALDAHQVASSKADFKYVLPNADTFTFSGFVKKFALTSGVDQIVKRQAEVRISGPITKTP